ncbi:hypothetical protein HRI_004464800 [Hibiscus trionum]|uniref:Uncharacterized protein n=1 Tax=Hibiscus trionum TaxID=183268 RepID=A0A9W7J3P8_HIBTR|nr:hypothetical protein HRI_004464800 [Hibiscus trionum]
MVDGVQTRHQQDIAKLQSDFQELENKLEDKIEKTISEKVQDIRLEVTGVRKEIGEVKALLESLVGKAGSSKGILGSTPSGDDGLEFDTTEAADAAKDDEDCVFVGETTVNPYKLKCPNFDGSHFRDWWAKLEQFFTAEAVPEHTKVKLVMLHLEGAALQWHHFVVRSNGGIEKLSWDKYLRLMQDRFAPEGLEDPMRDLVSLKQTSSVDQYYSDFVSVLNQMHLSDEYALSIFITNLKWEIGQYIKVFQPKDLLDAFRLALHFEQIVFNTVRKGYVSAPRTSTVSLPFTPTMPSVFSKASSSSSVLKNSSGTVTPVLSGKVFSASNSRAPSPKRGLPPTGNGPGRQPPADMEERRRKGLCFWCPSKYTLGHRCTRSQLFQLLMEGNDIEGENEEFVDCEDRLDAEGGDATGPEKTYPEIPVLSLQAMWGAGGCETMKVNVLIKRQKIVALIDSGSTHNFLSLGATKAYGLIVEQKHQMRVTIADGGFIQSLGLCRAVEWETQGHQFSADFLVLPLNGCDMVLGVQWLASLGSIQWDFSTLMMQFTHEREAICWKGLHPGSIQWLQDSKGSKMLKGNRITPGMSLLTMNTQLELLLKKDENRADLQQLLEEFAEVFREPQGLPPKRGHEHRIVLQDESAVVKIRPYRYPMVQKNEIEKLIKEMLQNGIIRDSVSPFASPIVMVKKKDGSWRLCVDYRQLNQLTLKDKFPIPIIEELLDELGEARFFSKLDLRSGYHQIRMWEHDIPKTAFRTHEGHYEFLVMPFGLTNAPATFQGLMNSVFKALLRKSVLVFFDDILVYSGSWEEHLKHIREVIELLKHHQLFARKNKCTFGATEVDYLGYTISNGFISMDSKKVQCIVEWPTPTNIKELRGFLGLSGYYRRFIKGYGGIAKPLTDLLKKNNWGWTEEATFAFEKLKVAMTSAHVLALPNFQQEFIIETDASTCGVGAVLIQGGRPLAYFSKGLGSKHQSLYIYDKEMLAVLLAVKKWSPYLVGRHFKIRTDHQSLKFLSGNVATTPAQQTWVAKMMGYDYEICYKRGVTNTVADTLSRNPEFSTGQMMAISVFNTDLVNQIVQTWTNDGKLQQIIADLVKDSTSHSKYSWDGKYLKRKGKLVVGDDLELKKKLIEQFHSSSLGGHSGADVTSKRMSACLYWRGLRKSVRRMVRECSVCQRNKYENQLKPGLLQPLPTPDRAWSSISMDFIEGLPNSKGKDTIFVVVDRLTKYAHFLALSHPFTALSVAQTFLDNIYKLHGLPMNIICDRDKVFMSTFWKELFGKMGVSLTPSTAYHPETDGQTEVVNRCLETYLRCMSGEKPREWSCWLSLAEWWYNTSHHSAINMTPFQALYGEEPAVHLPYLAGESFVASVDRSLQAREAAVKMLKFYLQRAKDRMKKQADKKRSDREFTVGDWVYLKLQPYRQQSVSLRRCHKLAPKWFGPFLILEKVGKVAYKLQLPVGSKVHPTFHVSQLKKHIGSAIVQSDLPVLGPDGTIIKEPVKILDRRMVKRGNRAVTEVLVEWTNSFPEDATWELYHKLKLDFPHFDP